MSDEAHRLFEPENPDAETDGGDEHGVEAIEESGGGISYRKKLSSREGGEEPTTEKEKQ